MTAGVRITGIEPTKTPTLPTSNFTNMNQNWNPNQQESIPSKETSIIPTPVLSSRTSPTYHSYNCMNPTIIQPNNHVTVKASSCHIPTANRQSTAAKLRKDIITIQQHQRQQR